MPYDVDYNSTALECIQNLNKKIIFKDTKINYMKIIISTRIWSESGVRAT